MILRAERPADEPGPVFNTFPPPQVVNPQPESWARLAPSSR